MKWYEEISSNMTFEGENADQQKADFEKTLKSVVGKHFVHADDFNQKKTELDELSERYKTDIAARDQQIEEIKKSAGNSEELQTKLEEMTKLNEQQKQDYDNKLQEINTASINEFKNNGLKAAIAKLTDDEAKQEFLMSKVNKDLVTVDSTNGQKKLIGLDDVVNPLATQYASLIETKKISDGGEPGGNGNPPKPNNTAKLEELRKKAEASGSMQDRMNFMNEKRAQSQEA